MIATIFGIALATGSIFMTGADAQQLLNTNQGVYMNDLGSGNGCSGIRYVASHSFNRLGKKIAALKEGDVITFDGCVYRVKSYEILPTKGTSYSSLRKRGGILRLQTCANDAGTYVFLLRLEVEKKLRKITIK